jgi:membrane-associated PAP2 superfamily phosphatase
VVLLIFVNTVNTVNRRSILNSRVFYRLFMLFILLGLFMLFILFMVVCDDVALAGVLYLAVLLHVG